MRHAELFPPDRGLQVRMVLAAVGTPLLVAAALVAFVVLLPPKILAGVAIAAVVGVVVALRERRSRDHARTVSVEEAPELHGTVERLCVLGDIPKPEIVIEDERQPNSWVIDAPGFAPRLHLTRGLLDLLDPVEVEAVIAHELAHVANRDATVMTVWACPAPR
jgi:heat shock protein HtpX